MNGAKYQQFHVSLSHANPWHETFCSLVTAAVAMELAEVATITAHLAVIVGFGLGIDRTAHD